MMFYDADDFKFLRIFKENIDVLQKEFHAHVVDLEAFIKNNSFDGFGNWWAMDSGVHPDQMGYDVRDGQYVNISLYKSDFPVKNKMVMDSFPRTLEIVNNIISCNVDVNYVAFFILPASCSNKWHSHARRNLIYHILLNDLSDGGCNFQCGKASKILLNAGDELVFDYSQLHRSENNSTSHRVNFIVDFKPKNYDADNIDNGASKH